jgi:hypothetical protein
LSFASASQRWSGARCACRMAPHAVVFSNSAKTRRNE